MVVSAMIFVLRDRLSLDTATAYTSAFPSTALNPRIAWKDVSRRLLVSFFVDFRAGRRHVRSTEIVRPMQYRARNLVLFHELHEL